MPRYRKYPVLALLLTGRNQRSRFAPPAPEPLTVSPNPMGPAGRLTVGLADEADVALVVYDALGWEVRALASGTLQGGAHPFDLDAAALPPGVYVARLTVDGAVTARRFTVVR